MPHHSSSSNTIFSDMRHQSTDVRRSSRLRFSFTSIPRVVEWVADIPFRCRFGCVRLILPYALSAVVTRPARPSDDGNLALISTSMSSRNDRTTNHKSHTVLNQHRQTNPCSKISAVYRVSSPIFCRQDERCKKR